LPMPATVYGRTKLGGEEAIRQVDGAHLIFRTSWLYSAYGQNFVLRVLEMAAAGNPLRIVDDQVGSPTWTSVVADATARIVEETQRDGRGPLARLSGTYHLSCDGHVSRYTFAKALFEELADRPGQRLPFTNPVIEPIATSQYAAVANRPRNSALSSHRFSSATGIELPTWQRALRSFCESFTSNPGSDQPRTDLRSQFAPIHPRELLNTNDS